MQLSLVINEFTVNVAVLLPSVQCVSACC